MKLMVKSESIATPRVELTELVRMAQQEDRSAFEEIVRRTTNPGDIRRQISGDMFPETCFRRHA